MNKLVCLENIQLNNLSDNNDDYDLDKIIKLVGFHHNDDESCEALNSSSNASQ